MVSKYILGHVLSVSEPYYIIFHDLGTNFDILQKSVIFTFLPQNWVGVGLWVSIYQNWGQITPISPPNCGKIGVKLVLWLWVVFHILIGLVLWLGLAAPNAFRRVGFENNVFG